MTNENRILMNRKMENLENNFPDIYKIICEKCNYKNNVWSKEPCSECKILSVELSHYTKV